MFIGVCGIILGASNSTSIALLNIALECGQFFSARESTCVGDAVRAVQCLVCINASCSRICVLGSKKW